jgi:hypothetical protein
MNTASYLFALGQYENMVNEIRDKKEEMKQDIPAKTSDETTMKEILNQMIADEKETPVDKKNKQSKRTNKIGTKK